MNYSTRAARAARNMKALLPQTFASLGKKTFGESVYNEVMNAAAAEPKAAAGNNAIETSPLWQVVAKKAAETVSREIVSIMPYVTDVQTDLQVRDRRAMPVVKVPVYSSVGDPLINATNWKQSHLANSYVDVQTVRVSRPAMISTYDMSNGEQLERTLTLLAETVAQGVYGQFMSAILAACKTPTAKPALTPESARKLSAIFSDRRTTHGLFLAPEHYAELIPTKTTDISPKGFGAFGIDNIARTSMLGNDIDGIAIARDAVAGMVGIPEILYDMPGLITARMPDVAGIPMLLKTHFDYETEMLEVSVESVCGFAVTVPDYVKTLTFGRAE